VYIYLFIIYKMSEKRPRSKTKVDKKLFMWGVVETNVDLAAILVKKSGSGNKWDSRYAVISRNYLIYYKPSSGDTEPGQLDSCKGFVNLGEVDASDVRYVHEKPKENMFQVPTPSRTFLFKCKDEKTIEKWVKLIKERAEAVSSVNPESLGNVVQSISTIQASFQKNMTFPDKVAAEGIPRFMEQTRKYVSGIEQWEPYLRKAALFLEFHAGTHRTYIDWFIGPDGPRQLLQRSEESILDFWRGIIEATLKEAKLAGRLRFFKEDFEETAQACEKAIVYIDALNQYHKEFMKNDKYTEQYSAEKQALIKLIDMFRNFPTLLSVEFKSYKGGKIRGKGAEWAFVHAASPQLKGSVRGTEMIFQCQAPEIMSPNFQHGSVIWNTKTWVWYHPKSSFLIRYDWNSQGNIFKFKSTWLEGLPKTEYCDWVLKGPSLQCVPEKGKIAPSTTLWEVEGSLPVPAALLAAMSEVILDALKMLNLD